MLGLWMTSANLAAVLRRYGSSRITKGVYTATIDRPGSHLAEVRVVMANSPSVHVSFNT
jgi:hypothetical protein